MKKTDYLSTLFVGIDIGSRTNVVSAIDFSQEYFIRMKAIPNAQGGAEQLEASSLPWNLPAFMGYISQTTSPPVKSWLLSPPMCTA